jgi:general secretion pathway protein A
MPIGGSIVMYLDFYRLKQVPFHVTPDPHFLFLSPSHKAALGAMIYGIDERQGFIAMVGEVGLGKTTIMRSYLERVDPRQLRAICIFNANVSFTELLKAIYQEFDLACPADDPFTLVNRLHQVLIHEYQQGRNVALLIDEAQNMPIETLENLRMLSNLETATQKLLQIVLIGQPELDHKLNLHELRQLKQRIVIHVTITPLTEEECWAYVSHRLSRATFTNEPIFTKQALKMLIKAAKGTPRVLNTLCTNALMIGFGMQQQPVAGKIAREVIAEFQGKGKEKRKVSPPKRWLVYVAVLMLLAVFFWLSPYKELLLAQARDLDALSRLFLHSRRLYPEKPLGPLPAAMPRQEKRIASQSAIPELVTLAPSHAQVTVDQRRPEGLLSVFDIENDLGEFTKHHGAEGAETPASAFPRVVVLQRGDSISKMALAMYGFVNAALIERIQRANPHIKNLDKVAMGKEIVFPAFPAVPE